jgi:RNA polymerase sigma factor (sigma-70 family)
MARDVSSDYRRLLASLSCRAARLGSQDPESAAQEALKRSLENVVSQRAVEYYFGDAAPAGLQPPEWLLDQLFAWLRAVLHNVIREERNRASYRREVPAGAAASDENSGLDPADPRPSALDTLIRNELEGILGDCFQRLDRESRTVLRMRADGLKYDEIAHRLGVNENTVGTWISRGIRSLGQHIRRRTESKTL